MKQSVRSDTTPRLGTSTLWGAMLCVAVLAGQSFAQTQTISSRVSTPGDDVEQKVDGGLMDFGSRVRQLRLEMAVSQEGLAELAGLHRTYVGSVERGERNISLLNIARLARALRTSPDRLLKGVSL